MKWTWRFFDSLMIIGGLIVGLAIWFIPSWSNNPQLKKMESAVMQRRAERLNEEAEEARIKKENEDEGLVYFGPTDKFFPGDHAKAKSPSDKPHSGR